MKKILALVLALAMVFGTLSFAAAAPADVEGTDYEDAVVRLGALGIIAGFPDGTYKPDEPVTRAQFAKIIVTALGVGEAANYAAGSTKFVDVPADHWAAGYINVAVDVGVIAGYPDGTFKPENPVTFAEAIKMIVAALGYTPKADGLGGYPGGYLAVAAEEGITDDISVVSSLAANRGDVALMIDNCLDVPLMVQTSWGQNPEYEPDPTKTLLNTKLDVVEFEATVDEIANVKGSKLKEDEVDLTVTKGPANNGKYEVIVDFDAEAVFGKEVKVWANDDDEIFFIEVKTDDDDILVDMVDGVAAGEVTLYVEDDTFDWAAGANVYINLETKAPANVTADMFGIFVLDDDEEVAFANVFDFSDAGVVLAVDDEVVEYVALDDADDDMELDLEDYDNIYVYNKDFTRASLDDLEEDVVFYYWERTEDGDDELFIVMVAEKAEGALERVKAASVRIDGTTYDVAPESVATLDNGDSYDEWGDAVSPIDVVEDLIGEDVVVLLDFNGEAVLITGDVETTSSTIYGVVTYADLGRDSEITVFTKDGEEVDYVLEDRAEGAPFDPNTLKYYEKSDGLLSYAVVSFKLNSDGEIEKDEELGYLVVTGEAVAAPADDNATKGAYVVLDKDDDDDYVVDAASDRYYISEDTVIMKAIDDKDLDPEVLDYEDIVEMAFTGQNAVVFGDAGKDADFIVFLKDAFTGSKEDVYYGVVTDSPYYDGDDYIAKVKVNDGEQEFAVANKANFDKGSMVGFQLNSKNEAVTVVLDDLNDTPADVLVYDVPAGGDKEAEIVRGKVQEIDGSYIELQAAGGTYRVNSDAVIYNIKLDDGAWKLGSEIRLSKLDTNDEVSLLLDDAQRVAAMVVYYHEDVTTKGASNLGL